MNQQPVNYDKRAQFSAQLAGWLILSLLLVFALEPLQAIMQSLGLQALNAGQEPLELQKVLWQWLVFSVPLCLFVRGIWQRQTRSALLLCLVLMVYLMGFMVSVISLGDRALGLLGLIQVSALLIVAMLFLHWQQVFNKQKIDNKT